MSKIVIRVKQTGDKRALLARIRQIVEMPLSEIVARVSVGRPLVEFRLFENDHEQVANWLKQFLSLETEAKGSIRFYELQPDEEFGVCLSEDCEISNATLQNILDGYDDSRARL